MLLSTTVVLVVAGPSMVDIRGSGGRISRRAVVWKAATRGRLSLMKAGFEAFDVVDLRMEEVMGLAFDMHWVPRLACATCRSSCTRTTDTMLLNMRCNTRCLCAVWSAMRGQYIRSIVMPR